MYNDGYLGKEAPPGSESSPGLQGVLYKLWKKGKDDKAAGKPYDPKYYLAVPAALPLAAKPVPLPTAPPAEEGGRRRRRKTKKSKTGKRKAKKTMTRRR